MLELGRHGGFILASYAATIVIMGAITLATVLRYRAAKARMRALSTDDEE